ncbi:atrophin 1 interacting protein 1, aip1, putative [Ixodes scapularis]|uniref:Atrophin 1 interacting protein 1, aip1, putative n=1 Tax=Ixodes scapularis TaxID=6945 RepID=B7QDA5_IXOSC|nr:atrophin 1 interacting protein 1, aip1, putative [Ixodes scapularis]|eukprot:XP_002413519.1 atrophin 1 interacting protein 1, aip1, putative [Ixodes scapularis]
MPDLSGSERPRSQPQRHNSADLLAPGGGPDVLDFGASSPVGGKPSQPPQFITVEIVKGTSRLWLHHRRQRLRAEGEEDPRRAPLPGLQEGDILAEIEGRDVRGRLHTEVVQALKDCPVGQGARITVHRGRHTAASPAKVKARAAKVRPSEDFLSKGSNSTFSHFALKSYHSEGYVPAYQGQYRSKTPTAELYSSRDKEAVVVSRPKTPLVDTRHWTSSEQHSPADDAHPNNNSSVDEAGPAPATTASSPAKPPRTVFCLLVLSNMTLLQDGISGRKHSTSFEHEQPVTSAALRQNSTGCDSSHSDAVDLTVTLHRQESGFGFRIVGGTEEGSQVSIGHIVPGGAADLDGRLQTGDEIVFVDSQNVLHASHHHVVQLMGSAALNGCVSSGCAGKARSLGECSAPLHQRVGTAVTYPYNVTVMRHENEGFGFVIISSVGKAGSTIGRIIENSPAERCGQLHVGDRILAVNGISILDMHHGEIVNLIKVSGLSVVLTIGPPLELLCVGGPRPGNRSLAPHPFFRCRGSRLARPGQLSGKVADQILEVNGIDTKNMTHANAINVIRQGATLCGCWSRGPARGPLPSSGEDMGAAVRGEPLDCGSTVGGEYHSVELQRGVRGFGFSIRGGREFHSMPLFVLRIADQGPAHLSGKLQVADQILEVNGIDTKNMTHANAINVIRQGGNTVRLLVKRTCKGPSPLVGLPLAVFFA